MKDYSSLESSLDIGVTVVLGLTGVHGENHSKETNNKSDNGSTQEVLVVVSELIGQVALASSLEGIAIGAFLGTTLDARSGTRLVPAGALPLGLKLAHLNLDAVSTVGSGIPSLLELTIELAGVNHDHEDNANQEDNHHQEHPHSGQAQAAVLLAAGSDQTSKGKKHDHGTETNCYFVHRSHLSQNTL